MPWQLDSSGTPDVMAAVRFINSLDSHPMGAIRALFKKENNEAEHEKIIFIGRAPGRIDLMGGIADYSGSLVLQWPIREATLAILRKRNDRKVKIVSLGPDRIDSGAVFDMDLADFEKDHEPITYIAAHSLFELNSRTAWAAYIAGAFLVLMREEGADFDRGADILIDSTVPEGKGVSSSAAVEVASMKAIVAAYNLPVTAKRLAFLAQIVENMIVGAPCGIMDQMTASCGRAHRLLSLRCQPAEILDPLSIPEEFQIWGIDSGIRHAVSGADYGSVRIGAFMGYRIILESAGLAAASVQPSDVRDSRWHGYLANLSPSEFEQSYRSHIPVEMIGSEFLSRYGETTDEVTSVDPERTYPILQPTAHPIYEHFRVRAFAQLMRGSPEAVGHLLGECMYQSHVSYSACGLGSSGTDELVRLARRSGDAGAIFGAKITGGGSGGTVAFLARHDAEDTIKQIADQYEENTGLSPYLFSGSSDGAQVFTLHYVEK